jgi:hypothetical protein
MRTTFTMALLAGGLVITHGSAGHSATPVHGRVQACLHGPDETPPERARRRDALTAARNVNNMQANQPGASGKRYLRHEDLAGSPFAQTQTTPGFKALNLARGEEILPGWVLTLDVGDDGYWFMIKDKTDPCGFAYISNEQGVIYTAEPIR